MYRFILVIFSLFISLEWSFQYIVTTTESQLYSKPKNLPKNKIGLVLGTSLRLKNGKLNPYFVYRMEAAAMLFNSNKVEYLIVSGDNHTKNYDEPTQMENYLIELGIPKDKVIKDYAGFRTFDSVIRAKKVFGQSKFTIISQKFHNQRALFICNHNDIDAIAFNAKDVFSGSRYSIREYFAKVKAVLDVFIIGTKPKFLGKPIVIN